MCVCVSVQRSKTIWIFTRVGGFLGEREKKGVFRWCNIAGGGGMVELE